MGSKFSLTQSPARQRGVITMFIAMVMLLLITVMVLAAYSLSTANLQIVGNVQAREEGIDAATEIIERTMQNPFYLTPTAQLAQPVDLNNDGVVDFRVDLAEPRCVRAVPASVPPASSVTLPGLSAAIAYDTIWELEATATEAISGASVRIVQGVRVLLSDTNKTLLCTGP